VRKVPHAEDLHNISTGSHCMHLGTKEKVDNGPAFPGLPVDRVKELPHKHCLLIC